MDRYGYPFETVKIQRNGEDYCLLRIYDTEIAAVNVYYDICLSRAMRAVPIRDLTNAERKARRQDCEDCAVLEGRWI